MDSNKISPYKIRKKVGKNYLLFLIVLFIILMGIGAICQGFLWRYLEKYELTTEEGSMRQYLQYVTDEDYETIYDESKLVYTQFNDFETYSRYIKEKYENLDLSAAAFKKLEYSTAEYHYYEVIINEEKIADLQLKQAEDGSQWYVRTNMTEKSYFVDIFNKDYDLFINDIPVNKSYVRATNSNSNLLKKTNLDSTYELLVDQMLFDNIIDDPDIYTKTDGSLVVKDLTQNVYYVGDTADEEQLEQYKELINKAAVNYCKYITKDGSYWDIYNMLYKGTAFQEAFATFENTWYTDHDSIAFENIDIYDIIDFEKGFMGTISFDYVVKVGDISKTYTSKYQMTFLYHNGSYLLADMSID